MKNQFKTKLIGVIALVLVSIMCLSSCNSDEMQAEIDAAESNVENVKNDVENVKTEVENVKKSLTDATTELKGLVDAKASATDLSSAVSTLEAAIKEAKDASTKNAADITAVNTAIDAANKAIEDANKAIEDAVKKAADELAAAQKAIDDKIAALQTAVDNKAEKADIDVKIDEIVADAEELGTKVGTLENVVNTIRTTDLTNIKVDIENVKSDLNAAVASIGDIEAQIQGYKDTTALVIVLVNGGEYDSVKYVGLNALLAEVEAKAGEYDDGDYEMLVNAYWAAKISLYRAWDVDEATDIYNDYVDLIEATPTLVETYRAVLEEIWADKDVTLGDKTNLDKADTIRDEIVAKGLEAVADADIFEEVNVPEEGLPSGLRDTHDYFWALYSALGKTTEEIVADIQEAIDALPEYAHICADNKTLIKDIEGIIASLEAHLAKIGDTSTVEDKVGTEYLEAFDAFKARVDELDAAKAAADEINATIKNVEIIPSTSTEKKFTEIRDSIEAWADTYSIVIDEALADGNVCDEIADAPEGYVDCNNEMIDWATLAAKEAEYEQVKADYLAWGDKYAKAVLAIGDVTLSSKDAIDYAQTCYGEWAIKPGYEKSYDLPIYAENGVGYAAAYFNDMLTGKQVLYSTIVKEAEKVVSGIVYLADVMNETQLPNKVGEAFTSLDNYEEIIDDFAARYDVVKASLTYFTKDFKVLTEGNEVLNDMLAEEFADADVAYTYNNDVILAYQDLTIYLQKFVTIENIIATKEDYLEVNAEEIAAIDELAEKIEWQTNNHIVAVLTNADTIFDGTNYDSCIEKINNLDKNFYTIIEQLHAENK